MTRQTLSLSQIAALLLVVISHGFAQQAPATEAAVVSSTASTAQSAAVPPEQETLPSPASYERLIDELEIKPNSLDVDIALIEAYSGLGNSLQTVQEHEKAVEAYGQALQLIRENKGLYALEQLPLVQARLVSSEAIADWPDVDAGRHLAYQIALKNPDAGVGLHYQTLRELGLWKLRAADNDLVPNPISDVQEMADLYRLEIEESDRRSYYQRSALSLANLYLDLAALEFLQAKKQLALPLSAYVESGQRTVTEMYCEIIPTPDGRGRQVCRNVQVPNMDYFLSLSDRKYRAIWDHLNPMQDAVLEAYDVLLPEVQTQNRDNALTLLSEVHSLTRAYNDFVAQNARRTGSRIEAPTGSRISR